MCLLYLLTVTIILNSKTEQVYKIRHPNSSFMVLILLNKYMFDVIFGNVILKHFIYISISFSKFFVLFLILVRLFKLILI